MNNVITGLILTASIEADLWTVFQSSSVQEKIFIIGVFVFIGFSLAASLVISIIGVLVMRQRLKE